MSFNVVKTVWNLIWNFGSDSCVSPCVYDRREGFHIDPYADGGDNYARCRSRLCTEIQGFRSAQITCDGRVDCTWNLLARTCVSTGRTRSPTASGPPTARPTRPPTQPPATRSPTAPPTIPLPITSEPTRSPTLPPTLPPTNAGECPRNCGSAARGGGTCRPNGRCTSCNDGRLRVSGRCYQSLSCKGRRVQTGSQRGQNCRCLDERCHFCTRVVAGDTCRVCRDGSYLLDGACVAACPAGMASMGIGQFKRRCMAPFECNSGRIQGMEVNYGCKCSTVRTDSVLLDFDCGPDFEPIFSPAM